jgi:integrase
MPSKIRKRGENTYELAVTNGYDYYGRQIAFRKTVKASNMKEAQKLYYEFESMVRRKQILHPTKIKLGDFAFQWYKEYCEPRLAVSTLQNYKRCLQQHIIPALGHLDIRELQPAQIVPFINALLEPTENAHGVISRNEQSALYCYRVLSSLLSVAVKWELIFSNPCDKLDPPKIQRHVVNSYNLQQAQQLLAAANQLPIREKTLLTLALSTGMRRGEILALHWQDIDFAAGNLLVTKSCEVVPHQPITTKEPKTENSMRCITLPASMIQLLLQYKQWQDQIKIQYGQSWNYNDWVFITDRGIPIHPSTVSHWFKRFLAHNGLPPMPFHGLRHTSATLLLAAGAPIKNVSSRLGHTDIRTTGNIYAQALQSADKEIANTMEEILQSHNDE